MATTDKGKRGRSQQPSRDQSPPSDDFEEFVAAALKVDPKGLSGKHRRDREEGRDSDQSTGSSPTTSQ